jgi:hypothetical protein
MNSVFTAVLAAPEVVRAADDPSEESPCNLENGDTSNGYCVVA